MDKEHFAFSNINYVLMAVSMVIVITGFILMSGGASSPASYDPTIFSVRRVRVAPLVCLAGFIMMGAALLYRPHHKR